MFKEIVETFKLVIAIPIRAEILDIIGVIQKYTGVVIVARVMAYFCSKLQSKHPK